MISWRARWNAFRFPSDREKQTLLRQRWETLPNELRTPNLLAGRHLTHCGFTTGASYCSFRHPLLSPRERERSPDPSLAQMKEHSRPIEGALERVVRRAAG